MMDLQLCFPPQSFSFPMIAFSFSKFFGIPGSNWSQGYSFPMQRGTFVNEYQCINQSMNRLGKKMHGYEQFVSTSFKNALAGSCFSILIIIYKSDS